MKRPKAETVLLVLILVGCVIAGGFVLDPEAGYRGRADRSLDVGDCLSAIKTKLDCDDPAFFYRVTSKADSGAACERHDSHVEIQGDHYCLDTKPLVDIDLDLDLDR